MKYLFQLLWEITKRASSKIVKFIKHKISRIAQRTKHVPKHSNKLKHKPGRRKSFKSFILEVQESQILEKSHLKNDQKWNKSESIENSVLKNEQEFIVPYESENADDRNKKAQKYFEQVQPFQPLGQCNLIFKGQDQIEISFIASKQAAAQLNLNIESDSDSQILKFINTPEPKKENKQNICIVPILLNQIKIDKKQWWQSVNDINVHSSILSSNHFSIGEQINNPQKEQQNIDNYCDQYTRKISKSKKIHRIKKGHLRVINLLDLVENQDRPKLYQIPLSTQDFD